MFDTTKKLKGLSVIVLGLAVLSLINIGFEVFFGELHNELISAAIPEGSPENILLIAKIFVMAVSVLFTLPQIYIGIKGLRVADDPDSSIGHIFLGIIVLIFTASTLITPVVTLLQGGEEGFGNVAELCSIAVDVFILFEYVRCAIAVRSEN